MRKNKGVRIDGAYDESISHRLIRKTFAISLDNWDNTSQRKQKAKVSGKRRSIIKQDRHNMNELVRELKCCYS